MSKPVIIGINLDYQTSNLYSKYSWYALRQNYFTSVIKFGGTPIALPYYHAAIDDYLGLISGLIIPGGRFDIDPHYYNDPSIHSKTEINSQRTSFEFELCTKALRRNMPVLGICGGMQLLNVVNGGSLIQYIPDVFPFALNHDQEENRHITVHDIKILLQTHLHQIYPYPDAKVNSSHRQAVKELAPNGLVSAIAPDSIIEGIEFPSYHFCMGIQWHPEFLLTDLDHAVLKAFIKAAHIYHD